MRFPALSAAVGLTFGLAVGCSGQVLSGTGPGPRRDGPPASSSAGASGTTTLPAGAAGAAGGAALVEAPSPRLLRQLTNAEYRSTVADLLGLAGPDTTAIPPDVLVDGFTTNVTGAFVTEAHLDAYSSVGTALAARAVSEARAKVVPCQTKDDACAKLFVERFGLRAFRRPLTDAEKARFVALFAPALTGGDFDTGVSLVLRALLVSPSFLFRSELGTDAGGGRFTLTPYEVASALSYTYWGTMPDDALFTAAGAGALASKAQLEAQARRLLADPRGRARIATFFSEWLEAPRAFVATKDMGTYPAVFAASGGLPGVVDSMRAEADAFVTNVVFDSTRKFDELFTADYTFADDRLATLYGLPPPGSSTVKKVALGPGARRGGLLTLGMFLMGHARTNESSPTQRGHLIRANFLCMDVPPPPPGVDATIKPGTPGKTARQQIEALTGSGTCAACHTLMNPIGFGLEGFDGAGQERTLDNGEPIDTSGQINGLQGATGPVTFNGPRELSNLLAKSDQARACLAASYHRYARGFAAKDVDVSAVDKLRADYLARDLALPDLFVQIALQDSFVTRRSAEVVER
jgi:Protein of unknown function (DUF1592)/Protein of unknown function (DUF1588)/Protein of unknown function (DUF1595)/Protein of unknown function (DUF1587)/Protein of unknown function (DUF1585)